MVGNFNELEENRSNSCESFRRVRRATELKH